MFLLLSLLGGAAAWADVRLEEQVRGVEVGVWVYDTREEGPVLLGSDTDSAEAADFGPFDRALRVTVDAHPDPFNNISEGTATQSSTVAPGRFHGSGRVEVYAESDRFQSRGLGLSQYRVTFAADEPQQYHLGTRMFDDPNFSMERFEGYVRLARLDPAGGAPAVVLDEALQPTSRPGPGRWEDEFAGTLPVGRYEFEFFTSQETDRGSAYGYEFEMTLATVPEPGAVGVVLGAAALLLRRRRKA